MAKLPNGSCPMSKLPNVKTAKWQNFLLVTFFNGKSFQWKIYPIVKLFNGKTTQWQDYPMAMQFCSLAKIPSDKIASWEYCLMGYGETAQKRQKCPNAMAKIVICQKIVDMIHSRKNGTHLTLWPKPECRSVVIAPGILLAMATYDGNETCMSVGLIIGVGTGSKLLVSPP